MNEDSGWSVRAPGTALPHSVPASLLATQRSSIPAPPAEVNVHVLYERLLATGILSDDKADHNKEEEYDSIKPVDFSQPGLVALLHSMQFL
jgi:hypothetical protein